MKCLVAVRIVRCRIGNFPKERFGDRHAPDVEFSALGQPFKRGATFVGSRMCKAPVFASNANASALVTRRPVTAHLTSSDPQRL
jgi:hypothetical protein